jgi:hypothetical protein
VSRVRITRVSYEDEDSWSGERCQVEVYVDDELLGSGDFGGEPEDNTEYRDYSWVRPLLAELARQLGAEVEETEEIRSEDEW